MADSDDDERPTRRLQAPVGRLDDQRAGFTTSSGSVATIPALVYGQPIYPPRPPRPAPKSAGSALLPSKPVPLQHISSWDYEDRIARFDHPQASRDGPPPPRGRRRSRPQLLAMSPTPFADPAAADQLSPPPTPETGDMHRRGSAVSTSSGHSLPLTYPRAPSSASASLKRRSVSSFGAYTINTIGDVSMSSSVPLLERSAESFYDNLSVLGWSPTGRLRASSSIATPAPVYLADYSFAKQSPSPARRLPRLQGNPLARLRKRLARSLAVTGRGRRLHTEVQLLLELVEALDACVASLAHPLEAEAVPPDRQLRASTSMLPIAPAQLASPPKRADPGGAAGHGSATSRLVAVDEVRLLVQELVELIPDAQRCLREGAYGPLTHSDVTTEILLESLDPDPTESASSSSPVGPTSPLPKLDSWPARLARDCRALLEEAGLPSTASGANAAAWLQLAGEPPADDSQPGGPEQVSSQFAGSP